MSGLLFLSSDDFKVMNTQKGSILCTNIPGFCLVLFYSTECVYCQDLIPVFKTIPGNVGGCEFGMINVSNNKKCVIMSRNTISPIKVVPYIVLFVNGKPYMQYKGPHTIEDISSFIIDISHSIQNKLGTQTQHQTQTQTQPQQPNPKRNSKIKERENDIPAYTIGRPLCNDGGVCYLDFDSAYGSTNL